MVGRAEGGIECILVAEAKAKSVPNTATPPSLLIPPFPRPFVIHEPGKRQSDGGSTGSGRGVEVR